MPGIVSEAKETAVQDRLNLGPHELTFFCGTQRRKFQLSKISAMWGFEGWTHPT